MRSGWEGGFHRERWSGHPLCVSRSGRVLLSPLGRKTLGPNVYAACNRKVSLSHPIMKCQTRGEASARPGFQSESSVWAGMVGILAEFGRTVRCLQRQPFGLRPGPSLGNFPSTGSAHWATLPWELLGKPGTSWEAWILLGSLDPADIREMEVVSSSPLPSCLFH